MKTLKISASTIVYGNAVVIVSLVVYFFFIPGILVVRNISDPALKEGKPSKEAWRLHRYLTPRYEKYVRDRIASKKAGQVYYLNVPGTEWPLFGSVFYLWATENLQKAWEHGDRSYSKTPPKEYARKTIEACKDLLLDPVHHTWVRKHWGDDYMHDQNVFFRSLIIAGLTSYENLTKSGKYIPLLTDQINTLADELDKSPNGILYDYPGECYPIDVFAAVAWIRMADRITGTDHSAFIEREKRAFSGDALDKHGMIPWLVEPESGEKIFAESRGIINSHILIFAHEIYPEAGRKWYELFEKNFWQETWYGAGWREFYRDYPNGDWTFDVDSGPIIGGFSPAANAFGLAAARANGRMDHAYTLAAQVLTASWPLLDGKFLGARILSDQTHSPYLGETGILWQLTTSVPKGVEIVKGGKWAGAVYIGFLFYFGISVLMFSAVFLQLRQWRKSPKKYRHIKSQFYLWAAMISLGIIFCFINLWAAIFLLLIPRILPLLKSGDRGVQKSEISESCTRISTEPSGYVDHG